MSRPRALDLFCGAGGAAMGLHRAGFDVRGVDSVPQRSYPFDMDLADALTYPLDGYDLIWASPPCQAYSVLRHVSGREYPELISAVRRRLVMSGAQYVIENVPTAPLVDPVMLCGTMFGLGVRRHRCFEASFHVPAMPCGRHEEGGQVSVAGHDYELQSGLEAMGIDWMRSRDELSEAVPPAYAEHIGRIAIQVLSRIDAGELSRPAVYAPVDSSIRPARKVRSRSLSRARRAKVSRPRGRPRKLPAVKRVITGDEARSTIDAFFAYSRERHGIYLRRLRGDPAPWTNDPYLRDYRFTNIFRELDRTTIWFRRNVRDRLAADPSVLLATVVFRAFNRISTGEAVFCQPDLLTGRTLFGDFMDRGDPVALRRGIERFVGEDGPFVTSAYIINTGPGMTKVEGVCYVLGQFHKTRWHHWATECLKSRGSMRLVDLWGQLQTVSRIGDFTAYEIVSDLRHTRLLDEAPDISTWANPGPGAIRGASRIVRGSVDDPLPRDDVISFMQGIVRSANEFPEYWPRDGRDWPAWEMRDAEHTLCEFDKYERVRLGQGRPRVRFRY